MNERSLMEKGGVRRGSLAALSDFNGLSSLPRPIAASQLNSNQWKSLIIPAACNAEELISVPVVRPYNVEFKKLWSDGPVSADISNAE
ncbi:hypothetical protein NQZ68_036664 [Dissostichus eleginoides]|nr:hypothetical protein NQZ68_036664 [Dissostichus eleginoides]